MSALRDFLATLLGGSVAATGADPVRPSQDRTDRAREIELRILMSNWM